MPCAGERFCGTSMCRDSALSSVCAMSSATALLDGADDDAGTTMARTLSTLCMPAISQSAVPQLDSGVLAANGEPLLTGTLLCAAGGSFYQRAVGWLETNGRAHVFDTSTATMYRLSLRDGGVVATGAMSSLSFLHDIFILQVVRSPSGAVVFNSGGFFAEGTAAGAWYFENVLFPMRVTLGSPWYVYEWTDTNMNGPDAADTFTRLAP